MSVHRQTHCFYEFGPFRVDPANRLLLRDGAPVPLPPKVMEALFMLVENQGRILEKDELMNRLWPDCFVEEGNLSQLIFQLRKALGESAARQQYVETIPKRGYRFVASVKLVEAGGAELRFTHRTGTRVIIEEEVEDAQNALSEQTSAQGLTSSIAHFLREMARGKRKGFAALATLILIFVAITGTYQLVRRARSTNQSTAPFQFQGLSIRKLTTSGKASLPALSPDGKYMAYALEDGLQQSLWVRQVATTSSVRIVPPAGVRYNGLTFSPDGNHIYYVAYGKDQNIATLSFVPALGGTPRQVIADVDSPITFSPDGKRFAFVRGIPARYERALMVANTDGTGERKLTGRQLPKLGALDGPAWSPDGKIIAWAAGSFDAGGFYMNLLGVNPENGEERVLTPQRWHFIGQIAWRGDGRAVAAVAWNRASSVFIDQLWEVAYPNGESRRITNDLNGYRGVSLATDGRSLVTVQSHRVSHFYVAPRGETTRARQITSGFGDYFSERLGICWTPGGRIVYGSLASGNPDLWVMNADGSQPQQLTIDEHADLAPAVTPDGRHIVFVSERRGTPNIWQMDLNGNNQKPLTRGLGEHSPSLSADGKWVIYSSNGPDKPTLWKVPLEGGDPMQLTDEFAAQPVVSPDGKLVACYYLDDQLLWMKLAVRPLTEGKPGTRVFNLPGPLPQLVQWTADSRMQTFITRNDGFANLWRLPATGGAPMQMTDFQGGRIFRFAWSRDGQLAYERGVTINDVVFIGDTE